MSFTAPWDETKPAGSRNLNLGDDDIREFKQQVRERMDVDGYFPSTDDANTGYHRKLTFIGQGSDPVQVASALILYSKTVGSYKELFSRHENAALQQLTLNGKLWIQALTMAGLAQGDVLYYDGSLMQNLAAGTSGQFLKTQGAGASPAWAAVSGSYIGGLARNLKITNSGSTHVVTLTADEVLVDDGAGSVQRFTSVSVQADIEAAAGAGGLDTGSENPTAWYYIWLIAKADGTKALMLSASSSSPTLPSGYTYKALMSAVRNNGSSNFVSFNQYGNRYFYTAWQSVASANVGIAGWTAIDTTGYVPSALSTQAFGSIGVINGSNIGVTNDSAVAVSDTVAPNKIFLHGSSAGFMASWLLDILTANTLYYESESTSNAVYLAGFTIGKNS